MVQAQFPIVAPPIPWFVFLETLIKANAFPWGTFPSPSPFQEIIPREKPKKIETV